MSVFMVAVPVPGGPLLAQFDSTQWQEHASLESWLWLCVRFPGSCFLPPSFSFCEALNGHCEVPLGWESLKIDFCLGILHSTSDQIREEVVFKYKFLNPYLIFIWVILWAWGSVSCSSSKDLALNSLLWTRYIIIQTYLRPFFPSCHVGCHFLTYLARVIHLARSAIFFFFCLLVH